MDKKYFDKLLSVQKVGRASPSAHRGAHKGPKRPRYPLSGIGIAKLSDKSYLASGAFSYGAIDSINLILNSKFFAKFLIPMFLRTLE